MKREIDLTTLAARLEQIRDLDPPMSIIVLNQLIDEVKAADTLQAPQGADTKSIS